MPILIVILLLSHPPLNHLLFLLYLRQVQLLLRLLPHDPDISHQHPHLGLKLDLRDSARMLWVLVNLQLHLYQIPVEEVEEV